MRCLQFWRRASKESFLGESAGSIVYAGKPWQTQQQQDRCEELGKYISKILANGKTYKFTREVSTYGLRGEGSTLSDYACGLAMGACFSRDYGFLVFSEGVEEYPLIAGKTGSCD